ncbi:MAG: hypothetical protein E6274_17105, partial [Clostridium sp.]|uniref:hypothetical protein n=1 Tax=Clostridium sp. TaxID=1506 RepID=UPI00290F7257
HIQLRNLGYTNPICSITSLYNRVEIFIIKTDDKLVEARILESLQRRIEKSKKEVRDTTPLT